MMYPDAARDGEYGNTVVECVIEVKIKTIYILHVHYDLSSPKVCIGLIDIFQGAYSLRTARDFTGLQIFVKSAKAELGSAGAYSDKTILSVTPPPTKMIGMQH
jgi:hypothetical protein